MRAPDTHPVDHDEGVRGLAIAPDDTTLVAGGGDGIVRFWTLTTGEPQKLDEVNYSRGWIRSIDCSPDGDRLVIACESGALLLTDAAGEVLREWQFPGSHNAEFTPDGRHLLTRNGNGTSYILRLNE